VRDLHSLSFTSSITQALSCDRSYKGFADLCDTKRTAPHCSSDPSHRQCTNDQTCYPLEVSLLTRMNRAIAQLTLRPNPLMMQRNQPSIWSPIKFEGRVSVNGCLTSSEDSRSFQSSRYSPHCPPNERYSRSGRQQLQAIWNGSFSCLDCISSARTYPGSAS